MKSLLEAVREACTPALWSRGVGLAREGRLVVTRGDGELVLRITTGGGMSCPAVTLYPDDAAWECACPTVEDACEHVAAAVIALQRAEEQGGAPIAEVAVGHLSYRFTRVPGGLGLTRFVTIGKSETALEMTLSARMAARFNAEPLAPTPRDFTADRLLEGHRNGLLQPGILAKLMSALEDCSHVSLERTPIKVETESVGIVGRVVDQNDGFRLFIEQDPSITEVFANGAALCGDTLRPIRAMTLTAREREQLQVGMQFTAGEVAKLVSEVLPDLKKRIPIQIQTPRLPRAHATPPRLLVETRRDGDFLVVIPQLVYGDPPTARVDGDRLVPLSGPLPIRDEVVEQRLARQMQSALSLIPGQTIEVTGAAAIELTKKLESWNGELRGVGHRAFFLASPLVPRLEIDGGNGFDLHFEAGGDADGAPPRRAVIASVMRAWRESESLVPLIGGGWAPIPAEWLARFGERVADLLAARAANDNQLPKSVVPELAQLAEDLEQPIPATMQRLRDVVSDFDGVAAATLPEDLTATLRSYQRRGVDWLCFLRDAGLGALLADDMGLGKTLQALCSIRGRTLVVAPTSVMQGWASEIARFRPALSASLFHGPQRTLDTNADVTLTTYAILRQDADLLTAQHWDTVVLDEAQNIKNPDSQVARVAHQLQAEFRLTLTGTPVENRLEELWSQLHFTNRGLLGSKSDFVERYARPVSNGDASAAGRLRERIRPFVLRRLKRDVAPELPPRTEVVLHCELSESERAVYDAVRAATLSDVVERLAAGGSIMEALEALLRLRQAACHSGLVPGQSADSSAKIEVLMETLDEVVADGHKALVFSQWTSLLDRVEPHLRTAGVAFCRLDGSTRDRGAVVDEFQSDEGPPIMLVSLKAGGTGLNLTAADHVFLLDPWWNPAVEDQAADRAHRIGQDRPVFIHRLVAVDTVEERILALQQHKRHLSDAALGGTQQTGSLTRDDLLSLLS